MSYTLPTLPYEYDALEPYIDSETMTIHHTRHHQGYVNNLNKAIEGTEAKSKNLEDLLKNISAYSSAVRNNAGGHYNHSLFWTILSESPRKHPQGKLAELINSTFGSLDKLKDKINQAALSQFGSGWAWLYVQNDGSISVTSTANQDNPLMDINSSNNGYPILGIDVWEHAYYLRYQNKRAEYLDNLWNIVDWEEVEKNFNTAFFKI